MKKFFSDFKAFINKGNVVDMAVGVVIATAFGAITKSLVADVIMPLISLATGANSIKELSVVLKEPILDEAGAVITDGILLNYGNFLQTIIDFLIIAFCVFVFIRVLTKSAEKTRALLKRKQEEAATEEPPAPPAPSNEEVLLAEIRDLLKNK